MSDRIHLATRKGVFTVDRRGPNDWRIATASMVGDPFQIVSPDARDGVVYAAACLGHFGTKVYRSTNHGESWDEIATPTYPPKPDDAPEVLDPFRKVPVPWNLEIIWAIEAGGADRNGRLWCGTAPGGLFRSDDSGASWELNRPLWDEPRRAGWMGGGLDWPAIHSICVDPRDPDIVRLGISCGGIWQTEDAGESWTLQGKGLRAEYAPPEFEFEPNGQDAHLLVQCPAEPDKFWIQHHNGIFRSTDATATFAEITDVQPSTFGFAVAVHPKDGDTAWFVPAVKDETRVPVGGKLVVTRTRDGGKSFDQLTDGLPQEHAYDLVFRHALAIDSTGERLAFGSTTGGLWISEDGGDSWATVSTHLPPIYCVRFG